MRAGASVVTSRYRNLAGGVRAAVVDLRAEVAEGFLIEIYLEDISKPVFRRDEVGEYILSVIQCLRAANRIEMCLIRLE